MGNDSHININKDQHTINATNYSPSDSYQNKRESRQEDVRQRENIRMTNDHISRDRHARNLDTTHFYASADGVIRERSRSRIRSASSSVHEISTDAWRARVAEVQTSASDVWCARVAEVQTSASKQSANDLVIAIDDSDQSNTPSNTMMCHRCGGTNGIQFHTMSSATLLHIASQSSSEHYDTLNQGLEASSQVQAGNAGQVQVGNASQVESNDSVILIEEEESSLENRTDPVENNSNVILINRDIDDISDEYSEYSSSDDDDSWSIIVQLPDRTSSQTAVASDPAEAGENGQSAVTEVMECAVCKHARKDVLILPCKHLCLCVNCAHRLVTLEDWSLRVCPLCRTRISGVINVYV